jgi:branched-chain amino acid transport system permease protein
VPKKLEPDSDFAQIAGSVLVFLVVALLGTIVNPYLISLLTIVFLFAFIGQSWSLMLGLGGQLSIGHALFVGIGAYSVAVLNIRYGLSPWIGLAQLQVRGAWNLFRPVDDRCC